LAGEGVGVQKSGGVLAPANKTKQKAKKQKSKKAKKQKRG
jgi:hypothetical protein